MTIKQAILGFMSPNKWYWGGQIEDFIRGIYGHKASNASRRCRELVNEGKLVAEYERIGTKGNKVVRYKLAESKIFRPEIVKKRLQERLI